MWATVANFEKVPGVGTCGMVVGLGDTRDESIAEPAEYESADAARRAELLHLTFPCTDTVAQLVRDTGAGVIVRLIGTVAGSFVLDIARPDQGAS